MPSILVYISYLLVAYVLLTMALYTLSNRYPKLSFYACLLASYLSLLVCSVYGVIASIVLRLIGYGQIAQWATARSFKWTMRYTTRVKFVIEGEEHLKVRPAVFIGNHQTYVSRSFICPRSSVWLGRAILYVG